MLKGSGSHHGERGRKGGRQVASVVPRPPRRVARAPVDPQIGASWERRQCYSSVIGERWVVRGLTIVSKLLRNRLVSARLPTGGAGQCPRGGGRGAAVRDGAGRGGSSLGCRAPAICLLSSGFLLNIDQTHFSF